MTIFKVDIIENGSVIYSRPFPASNNRRLIKSVLFDELGDRTKIQLEPDVRQIRISSTTKNKTGFVKLQSGLYGELELLHSMLCGEI